VIQAVTGKSLLVLGETIMALSATTTALSTTQVAVWAPIRAARELRDMP
jgi:hypothetical protein